jgi:hypothetical protein
MLEYSVTPPGAARPLPVVAYGGAVRRWARRNLGVRLRVSAAPAYARIGHAARIPMLGANHPSLFWHVAQNSHIGALRVMRDDLVAACWQVGMGADPARDMDETLRACARHWDARDEEVCEQTELQGYDRTPAEARLRCAHAAPGRMRAARALTGRELMRIEHAAPAGHRTRTPRTTSRRGSSGA